MEESKLFRTLQKVHYSTCSMATLLGVLYLASGVLKDNLKSVIKSTEIKDGGLVTGAENLFFCRNTACSRVESFSLDMKNLTATSSLNSCYHNVTKFLVFYFCFKSRCRPDNECQGKPHYEYLESGRSADQLGTIFFGFPIQK